MQLEELLTNVGKSVMGMAATAAIGACVGYNYALYTGTNTLLTVQAVATAAVAAFIFRQCVEVGFEDQSSTVRNFIHLVGFTTGGITAAQIFKKLEIFSPKTATLACYAVIATNLTAMIVWLSKDYVYEFFQG